VKGIRYGKKKAILEPRRLLRGRFKAGGKDLAKEPDKAAAPLAIGTRATLNDRRL
jgi:hypothetical protein